MATWCLHKFPRNAHSHCNKHTWWKEVGPYMSYSDVVGFIPSMHGQFRSNHLSHGWHWCEGLMWPSQHLFSQCIPQPYFLWTRVFSFQMCACSVLQLLLWISTLTNQFIDLEALLFPKKTNISMPHGKIQLMFVCLSLNVAFVQTPPSTNLEQNTMCIHKLSCRYCISLYHIYYGLGS